jgi:hypothetical protein
MSSRPAFDLEADAYRRRIRVTTVEPRVVRSDLQDDFHHFVITLLHDGEHVVSVDAESLRWPWSTCPGAAEPLRRLTGMRLEPRFTAAGRWTDPKQNCTHQFDAACHAITHAAHRRDERVYDLEIPRRDVETGASRCRSWIDGVPDLDWHIDWNGIVDAAPPFDAAPWRGGFMRWADDNLPPDEAERAIALRRACDIGMGRGMNLDAIPVADQLPESMAGICHTMQPGTVNVALRHVGSIRDYARDPDLLDASDLRR